ncbi:pyridoxamine 5'-phosphate oxidase-related FMN-binding protein [Pseudonocardia dioxanivorans CB1190]|uniref:Pyridoxamine 5'-phosphate oxidase-related FMN-binding protein n=1 Tax=Pseudonocardia dioxanivorans (strain ATCC 55486 / DSM 44775 / JCM 13855 / CB1190) TaxID=675635 RepID=F4CX96_PSEUX|nr:pyridoxamine 5'-phosphate oxidase-related FMN-binding protein [Pseudonocardia dioxanivorans CB1190]
MIVKQQRRARAIAMTPDEIDAFLAEQRTCRVATNGTNGPHATPLWYAWHDGALWLTSLSRSQRWTDLMADPRIAAVVDAGHDYNELRGVELRGRVEVVGEAPRTGEPCPELDGPEQLMADRYHGGVIHHDGRHAWLRLRPEKITSWDFRKLPADRQR